MSARCGLLRREQHLVEVGERHRVLAELPRCRSSRARRGRRAHREWVPPRSRCSTTSRPAPPSPRRSYAPTSPIADAPQGPSPSTAASSCLCNSSHWFSPPPRPPPRRSRTKRPCSFSPSRLKWRSPSSIASVADVALGERPRSPVPHDHVAAAVLAAGDDALEVEVVERMILDLHGHALHVGIERRPLRAPPSSRSTPSSSRRKS